MIYNSNNLNTQNELLMSNLMKFYKQVPPIDDIEFSNLPKMMKIVNGESIISLRIIDWFVTNYAKKNWIIYMNKNNERFKVYNDYKLKLKAYSKRNFDPFCRWDRVTIPCGPLNTYIETTIGQLNFFKWAIENQIIEYIESNYTLIENDMNQRNSTSKKRQITSEDEGKTRKKREELSISAVKCIKKENFKVIIRFT
jgi:hypothetical protein